MGCGKSSVGRRLSELLCCPFIDLDEVIEERAGRTIPEIFASDGEEVFRRMELQALQTVVSEGWSKTKSPTDNCHTLVLALGGGTVMTPDCADIVHSDTTCIYLKASADTLTDHLSGQTGNRPLLRQGNIPVRNRITDLMSQRSAAYEKTAHITIDTDGKTIEDIAAVIARKLTVYR